MRLTLKICCFSSALLQQKEEQRTNSSCQTVKRKRKIVYSDNEVYKWRKLSEVVLINVDYSNKKVQFRFWKGKLYSKELCGHTHTRYCIHKSTQMYERMSWIWIAHCEWESHSLLYVMLNPRPDIEWSAWNSRRKIWLLLVRWEGTSAPVNVPSIGESGESPSLIARKSNWDSKSKSLKERWIRLPGSEMMVQMQFKLFPYPSG